MRELARKSLGLELGRGVRDERGDRAGLTADGVSRRALVAHEDLAWGKREALDDGVAVACRETSLGEGLSHPRKILAELRPERLELRFHDLAHESLRVVAHLEGLHVELVADDRRELFLPVEGAAVAVVRLEDGDELRQRRPHLGLRGRARGAAEGHDAHRGAHAPLEVIVDPFGAHLGIRRQVHRLRRAGYRAPDQVLVKRLGEERHDRCEEPRQRRERLVQRLIRGEGIASRLGLPEAGSVASHVPGRQVVPERFHPQCRGLRVVLIERGPAVAHQPLER